MIGRVLLLVALLALAVLVLNIGAEDESPERAPVAPEPPRYYLRDATVTEFGPDGGIRYALSALRATEDPGAGTVQLEGVALDYLPEAGQEWHVTAARGQLRNGATVVDLEGDVEMTGRREGLPQPAVLRSPRLALDTEARLASTSTEVELDLGQHSLRARGMRADLKGETLQLESSVNGRFIP